MTKRQLKRRAKRVQRRTTKQWKRLTLPQRTVMVAGAVVQVTLFAAAQIDITRRTADEIRGPKLLWRMMCFVNFIGPMLYFAVGRVSPTEPVTEEPEVSSIVA